MSFAFSLLLFMRLYYKSKYILKGGGRGGQTTTKKKGKDLLATTFCQLSLK